MKKTPLLNIALSEVIASLGHGDMLVIGDAGLPILRQRNSPGHPFLRQLWKTLARRYSQTRACAGEPCTAWRDGKNRFSAGSRNYPPRPTQSPI